MGKTSLLLTGVLIVMLSKCGAVSMDVYPPAGHWYSAEPYLSIYVDENIQHAYHGTYEIDGEIKDAVVFASGISNVLEVFDISVYNFETGGYNTVLDFPIFKGTFESKNGKLYFNLTIRNDGIEDLETIIMENIAEE